MARTSHQTKDRAALIAIREIESTITGALAGRCPSALRWGPINADKFLAVVQDVAAFVHSNFSSRSMAPICTIDVHRFARSYPIGCFARRSRIHAPWSIDVAANTLAQVCDPGLRRCALYWTRELMHAASARPCSFDLS